MTEIDAPAFELQYQDVAPFPLERFLAFISHLKVQSKDFGLVPFRLLGSQRYILDEICKGLAEGITTFVILKSRQLGSTTFFLALDMFWAFEHAGLLGVLLTHKEEARDDFRAAIEVFFAETPRKFMVKYVRHNRNLLILRNASKFRYLIAGTQENRRGGLGRSGAANFVHSCMAPGTPVIVEHGRIKPVEHVEIGERVLTHSGAVAVVIDVIGQRNTKGDLIEITPWLGSKIAYTSEHKIPTERGIVQASEIRLTDRLVMPIRKITKKTSEIVLPPDSPRQFNRGKKSKGASAKVKLTEDFGFACGYYLAEGTVTHQSGGGNPSAICFYRHRSESAYADRAISALSSVASRGKTQSRNGCLTDVDTAYGMPLATWMKQTFGYADNKIIPDFVFDWGEDFCRGLLCGLLCGDGSKTLTISNRKYSIARMQLPTTRSSLATQSRDLAASLGLGWASITHIPSGRRSGRNCKELWRVVWCGEAGRKLNALIGIEVPSGGRKQTEKYSMDYNEGRVLIGIRSLSVRENVSEIWDISVDHDDHTFRTPHMSTSNTETAFYGSGDSLNEFRSQTSSLYPHRLQIYETTANGFNHFHDMWEQARTDPTKGAIFVGWWRDERNQFPVSHPFFRSYMPDGIATALTPLERRRVREVRDEYGFEISLQQIAWYRWHLASEKDGDQAMMDQEYPWTEDDAFQATGSKFFTVEAVTNITREAKKLPFQTYRYKLTHKFEETRVAQVKDARAELRIWEEPSKFGYYVVGADPAYGSSDEADRSCASVWRCFSDACIQVAEYCTPQPSTYQFAWVLAHLAGYYGANFIMPVLEISGPGQAVFDELNKVYQLTREVKPTEDEYGIRNVLQYMRHFFYKRMDSVGGGEIVYQWRTTEELKRRMMNQLKNGIELGRMVPRSLPLCEEMRRIVNDDGHIGGEGTAKDDRVMAAALAYQGFNMWVQPKAKSAGMSVARSATIEEHGGTQPLDRLVTSFMKKMNIEVKR